PRAFRRRDRYEEVGHRRSHAGLAEEGRELHGGFAPQDARSEGPRHGLALLRARRGFARPARHPLGDPPGHGDFAGEVTSKATTPNGRSSGEDPEATSPPSSVGPRSRPLGI